MTKEGAGSDIVVFEASDGEVRVDVRIQGETVWLTQEQMAKLFGRERSVVTKHIRNVFREGELEPLSTCAKFAQVRSEGDRTVSREVDHYNLDVVISVGYRVNSKRGTQFRIWATRLLREHLVRGFTLNDRRLQERGLDEMRETVEVLARTLTSHALVTDEGLAVLDVVRRYSRSWKLLLEYDENRLPDSPARSTKTPEEVAIEEVRAQIGRLKSDLMARGEASELFGQERGSALAGILGAIEQTFGGTALYPSAQVRAANLLYFVIKDHPFSDGNKRIGTLLFLDYMRRHGLLVGEDGRTRFDDRAMVALALLIAESQPSQKDLMIRLVIRLMEDEA